MVVWWKDEKDLVISWLMGVVLRKRMSWWYGPGTEVTLKILVSVVLAGIAIYFLIKFCLCLYRPFFLAKTFQKIEEMYNRLLASVDKDITHWVQALEKWRSEATVNNPELREDSIMEQINTARARKNHEEEVYGKFVRLRERFIKNPTKLSESITTYQRYLTVRIKQNELATVFVNTSGTNFDEVAALSNEIMITLEETERKLDNLLSI